MYWNTLNVLKDYLDEMAFKSRSPKPASILVDLPNLNSI